MEHKTASRAQRITVRWLAFACLGGLALAAQAITELRHAHGIGYSADGGRIFIPNHYGIAVYGDGRWSKVPGPRHDYMGFVVTRNFIFSSGHAAGSRGASNPLGLMRSGDGGRTWTKLSLEGQVEFHVVAAGYLSNVLYVYNAEPNSAMPKAGIYRATSDLRPLWHGAAARGLDGDVGMLTAHPTEPGTIAAATTAGLFLSHDGGDEFKPILPGLRATAACFAVEGDALLVGTLHGKQPGLLRIAIKDGIRKSLTLPPFGRDAVANIVQNPARRTELALISFERAVYVSPDGGKTWKRIARPRGTLPAS